MRQKYGEPKGTIETRIYKKNVTVIVFSVNAWWRANTTEYCAFYEATEMEKKNIYWTTNNIEENSRFFFFVLFFFLFFFKNEFNKVARKATETRTTKT